MSIKITDLPVDTSPIDTDVVPMVDVTVNATKKLSWANLKATLLSNWATTFSPFFSTSAGLAALLSDETGSAGGVVVFSASPTIVTPTIASMANAQHNHTNAAGGGQITDAALSAQVGIAKGGTGQVTANAALNALLPTQTGNSGKNLQTDGGNTSWVASGAVSTTAQENITANDAVVIGLGTIATSVPYTNSTGHATIFLTNPTTTWFSQSFTTSAYAVSIAKITFYAQDNSTSSVITASIRTNSAGQPTGADISSITGTVTPNVAVATLQTLTFSSPIPVSPNTTYHVIFRGNSTNVVVYGNNSAGQGTNSSANSGSTWSASNGALELVTYEIDTVSGQISRSTASVQARDRNSNFIGFAISTTTAGQQVPYQQTGIMAGFSGLTPGLTYYLSNTTGAISTSPGTTSVRVGIAISATQLLIKLP